VWCRGSLPTTTAHATGRSAGAASPEGYHQGSSVTELLTAVAAG
jgi:hypothetical protein